MSTLLVRRWAAGTLAGTLLLLGTSARAADARSAGLPERLLPGIEIAQACEPEIDSDFSHYTRCIDSARLHLQARLGAQAQAGLLFQAWLMADLAAQQDSAGSHSARQRWWRDLERQLRRSRLSLDDISRARGLAPAEIRQRATRAASGIPPS